MHPSRPLPPPFAGALCALLFLSAPAAHAQAPGKRPTPIPKRASSPAASPGPDRNLSPDRLGVGAPAGQIPDVVAIVEGQPVKRDELEKVFAAMLSSNGRNLSDLSDADRRRGYRAVLDEMITDRIVSRLSAGEKIFDPDVERGYLEVQKGFSTPEAFAAELKKTGQTPEQIKAKIRGQLQQKQWIEKQIADKLQVSEEDAAKYYKENPDRFNLPEMVQASHILLAVRRDAAPEISLEKEKLASEIVARARKGEAFDALAKQYSDDPNTKNVGGDLDFFSRERIMPEFAAAAFKLKIGEISDPVRTQYGFHVIKATGRRDARTLTFDEAKGNLTQYLIAARRQEEAAKLVVSLRDGAKVEIRLP